MKKFNHLKAFQGILVVTFLFISTISFGQRVSLKSSGGSEPWSPELEVRICEGQNSTFLFYFDNNAPYNVQQAFVNTSLNANISTSQAQNSTLNSGARLYVEVTVSKSQWVGSFDVSLTYFDPILSTYCTALLTVIVEECEEERASPNLLLGLDPGDN